MYSCKKTPDNTGNNTVVIPLAPSNLFAVVLDTTIVKLTWKDNSTNEVGYKVQRKTNQGNFADIASTAADMVSYIDLGLTPNTTYTYRIYGYNTAGNSVQYSNEVTITTNRSSIGGFVYGAWSVCDSNGFQIRTYTSTDSTAIPPTDSIIRTCVYNPVAIFTYSAWSVCSSSNLQTRTYTSTITGAVPPTDSILRSCVYSIFTYGAWSACSSSNIQTRIYTSSVAGAIPPTDSISRPCNYVPPVVIFNYGSWTGSCTTEGVQRRSVVSTVPPDSFNVAYPPIDSIIRICPGIVASFPGTYKITKDTLFTKLAGSTTYNAGENIYSDTSWNPTVSLNDLYVYNANGTFTYNDGGTPVPVGSGTSFLSYPYSNTFLGGFATGWSLRSGFLVYTPEANFGAWGYFEQIIPTKFVLNYSFTNSSTGNKYIQSTTYTKQ